MRMKTRLTGTFLLGMASLLSACGALNRDAEPHRVLFLRIAPYKTALFTSKADGSDERPLVVASSRDYNPAWSRDGQWIVFTSERDGQSEIYRVRPDGTALERLTNQPSFDDQAAVSPDGNQIVFVSTRAEGTADLWILDVRTGTAKPLTSGPGGDFRPAWSPDGNWIAFSSDRGSNLPPARNQWEHLHLVDVYVTRPDGSGLKRLTEHGNFCGSPKWSRDSRRVVAYCMTAQETFAYRMDEASAALLAPGAKGDTRLVSIDVATGDAVDVPAGPGVKIGADILPSGEIAYVRRDSQAGVFYREGKPGPTGAVRSPSWSPDGARVVYHKILDAVTVPDWEKTFSRDSRYDLILTRTMPSFDPSGDRFVATVNDGPDFTMAGDLAVIETAGRQSRTIFHQDGKAALAAQWSPGGDTILFGLGFFFAGRERGAQVAMIRPDGSGFRQLTSGANNNAFPSPSPDGKQFVYRTMGAEGQGLRIQNVEGGPATTLTTDYDTFPVWSPRGDLIIFVRQQQSDFEIFSIRPDGKDLRRLTSSPGNDSHMAFSPDGEWIVFTSARMGFKDEAPYTDAPQPYGEIFVMRYDGKDLQQLTDNQWEDGAPTWQPR
jgi:TolB protein